MRSHHWAHMEQVRKLVISQNQHIDTQHNDTHHNDTQHNDILSILEVIAMSGSASSPFLHIDRQPSVYAKAMARHFGAKSSDSDEELIQLMRSVPGKSIVHKTTMFKGSEDTEKFSLHVRFHCPVLQSNAILAAIML